MTVRGSAKTAKGTDHAKKLRLMDARGEAVMFFEAGFCGQSGLLPIVASGLQLV